MSYNPLLSLAINRMDWLRPQERLLLSEIVDSEQRFCALHREALESMVQRKIKTDRWNGLELLRMAEQDWHFFIKRNIWWTTYPDSSYPPLLREIYDPPFLLYVRGTLPMDSTPSLGIVGTRMPSGRAKKAAYKLGIDAGIRGVPVISGLARGIDGVVHKGCIASAGKTFAVLGSGIDTIYPKEHKKLAIALLECGGGIVSEYPPGIPPIKFHFPARNRIISGFSRGVIVVECPKRSGALITADYALEQGRDLFVHAAGMYGKAGEGTAGLAEEGAVTIVDIDTVLNEWGMKTVQKKEQHIGEKTYSAGRMMGELLERELLNAASHYCGEYYGSSE